MGHHLADHKALAGTDLELAHVDGAAAQADAVLLDLPDASDPDEDPTPLNGDYKPIDPWRLRAEAQHNVRDAPDLSAVGAHQRQARQPGNVHEPVSHEPESSRTRQIARRARMCRGIARA